MLYPSKIKSIHRQCSLQPACRMMPKSHLTVLAYSHTSIDTDATPWVGLFYSPEPKSLSRSHSLLHCFRRNVNGIGRSPALCCGNFNQKVASQVGEGRYLPRLPQLGRQLSLMYSSTIIDALEWFPTTPEGVSADNQSAIVRWGHSCRETAVVLPAAL